MMTINREYYETIADELTDDLNGNCEFVTWGERPAILFSQPAHQPNMHQKNRKNETPVFIDEHRTKNEIKAELLTWGFINPA